MVYYSVAHHPAHACSNYPVCGKGKHRLGKMVEENGWGNVLAASNCPNVLTLDVATTLHPHRKRATNRNTALNTCMTHVTCTTLPGHRARFQPWGAVLFPSNVAGATALRATRVIHRVSTRCKATLPMCTITVAPASVRSVADTWKLHVLGIRNVHAYCVAHRHVVMQSPRLRKVFVICAWKHVTLVFVIAVDVQTSNSIGRVHGVTLSHIQKSKSSAVFW